MQQNYSSDIYRFNAEVQTSIARSFSSQNEKEDGKISERQNIYAQLYDFA